jgi:hypothetical protein
MNKRAAQAAFMLEIAEKALEKARKNKAIPSWRGA